MERQTSIQKLFLSETQKNVSRNPRSTSYGSSRPIFEMPPFNIQGLPAEIRLLVFQEYILACSEETPNSRTPPLVKALRPSPVLYNEALEAFYLLTYCIVSLRNRKQVFPMDPRIFKRASLLRVWYGIAMPKGRMLNTSTLIAYCPDNLVALCSNVRELHITTDMTLSLENLSWDKRLLSIIRKFVVSLPLLERLIVDVPIQSTTTIAEGPNVICQLIYPAKPINKATGILHQWTADWRKCVSKGRVSMTWASQRGQFITWTDEDYCESVPWANTSLLSYNYATLLHRWLFKSERNLHFLGLNPRILLHLCRKTNCRCEGLRERKLRIFDPVRWLELSCFSGKTLNEESDLSIYRRNVGTIRQRSSRP